MEKHYDASADIWGIGCIFAELLNCLCSDKKLSMKEKILLPGTSCYPLSPATQSKNDQLNSGADDDGEQEL